MHIAILDEELPYPLTSGKRIRTYNLLRRLASRHRLTYVCHRNADRTEAENAASHFAEIGIHTVVVDRTVPPKSGIGFYSRLAGNLLSSLPYSVSSHQSTQLQRAMADLTARDPVDLWHCEWTPYAEYLRGRQRTPWLVVAHNVESLIWQRYAENESNPAKRWYIRKQWHKFFAFERWAYSTANRTIAVSPDDALMIRNEFGGRDVAVVDNGVDTDYFRPTDAKRDPKTLLFLGSLDWRPNQDGVRLLLDNIFPLVRQQEPNARLSIVGRNPPNWLREQASQSAGVELHGSVPDVRPFIAQATVLAVPLRIGGGSRLKILEALAAGLPVVSSRIGAEGLDLHDGVHLDITEGIEPMADALVAAMRNHERTRKLADVGRKQVLHRYDWEILKDRLEECWRRCVTETTAKQAA